MVCRWWDEDAAVGSQSEALSVFFLLQMCQSQTQTEIRGFSAGSLALTASKLINQNQTEAFTCLDAFSALSGTKRKTAQFTQAY